MLLTPIAAQGTNLPILWINIGQHIGSGQATIRAPSSAGSSALRPTWRHLSSEWKDSGGGRCSDR
eukprot:scaffold306989_cov29-Prasinocladus_malaysianus.AAC.1